MTTPDEPSADSTSALEDELLGGPRRYTRIEVAERAGVSTEHARRLWRALGFAEVADDKVVFTERDVEALVAVQGLMNKGLMDADTQLAMTRAMGQSLARLAEWQVSALTTALGDGDQWGDDAPLAAAQELVPVMESLIGYVWRRHLAATSGRLLGRGDEGDLRTTAVGFADLVGFTSLTRHAEEDELAVLVERFERLAQDVVAEAGGRIIKTVGDEVMFAADDPLTAAEIALSLLDEVGRSEGVPDLRVGLAFGMVLPRLGDLYGEPVNIASRLTTLARPGSALVDRELATALEGDNRFRLRRVPPRPVRGYALLQPFRLRWSDAAQAADGDRAAD